MAGKEKKKRLIFRLEKMLKMQSITLTYCACNYTRTTSVESESVTITVSKCNLGGTGLFTQYYHVNHYHDVNIKKNVWII